MAKKKKKLQAKYKVRRAFLVIVLLVAVGGLGYYIGTGDTIDKLTGVFSQNGESKSVPELENQPSEPATEPSAEEPQEEPEPEPEQDDEWSLLLVNPSNPLPDDFEVELETIYEEHRVDTRIAQAAREMMTQAKLDGIIIFPCSSYRTVEYQQGLYDNKYREHIAAGETEEEAAIQTSAYIATPGCSEHHTGLAVDFVTEEYQVLDEGFAETPAFKWLNENAYKFGFILRYPINKVDITKIEYEPWHYRYVGIEHAEHIKENGYCLEEYLALLRYGVESGGAQSAGNAEDDVSDEDTVQSQG